MWTSKISRARTLKDSLQKDIDSFFVSRPYKISTKVDPQSRRLIYYLTDVIDVPEDIALLTGDIIQNLRSSLDHLAYELFTKNLGSLADGRHVYFPIADDLARYKDQIRKMTWLKQNAKD